MSGNNSWQNFCLLYYDQAISSARYNLNKIKKSWSTWDERIDEDVIIVDAAMEALQKAFIKYDPTRGASVKTFLSNIVHNEVIDELDRETESLATLNDVTASQEADFTFSEMTRRIPENAFNDLKAKLHNAILKLSPVDQSILGFFLKDPSTFIEKSVEALGVAPGYVSVHKTRALAKLPSLMGVSSSDYFDLYEDHLFAGDKLHKASMAAAKAAYSNPICPEFDLEETVSILLLKIRKNS